MAERGKEQLILTSSEGPSFLVAGKNLVPAIKPWVKVSAICWQVTGLSAECTGDVSDRFLLDRRSYFPLHTLTDLKQIGTLGGSIGGEDATWILTGLLNATAKTWGPTTMPSYSITSPGTISITQTQTAPPHSPLIAFQWHSLGNTGGVFNPKHGTWDAAKGCSHSATPQELAPSSPTDRPLSLSLPALTHTQTHAHTQTDVHTHPHAGISSWAPMWLQVTAGNKSSPLVSGWIAWWRVNPIANPNNTTFSSL